MSLLLLFHPRVGGGAVVEEAAFSVVGESAVTFSGASLAAANVAAAGEAAATLAAASISTAAIEMGGAGDVTFDGAAIAVAGLSMASESGAIVTGEAIASADIGVAVAATMEMMGFADGGVTVESGDFFAAGGSGAAFGGKAIPARYRPAWLKGTAKIRKRKPQFDIPVDDDEILRLLRVGVALIEQHERSAIPH